MCVNFYLQAEELYLNFKQFERRRWPASPAMEAERDRERREEMEALYQNEITNTDILEYESFVNSVNYNTPSQAVTNILLERGYTISTYIDENRGVADRCMLDNAENQITEIRGPIVTSFRGIAGRGPRQAVVANVGRMVAGAGGAGERSDDHDDDDDVDNDDPLEGLEGAVGGEIEERVDEIADLFQFLDVELTPQNSDDDEDNPDNWESMIDEPDFGYRKG